jgi:hypothetical protein
LDQDHVRGAPEDRGLDRAVVGETAVHQVRGLAGLRKIP